MQNYKKAMKLAIPRNRDANIYQHLSIANILKSMYLCTRNQKSAVMSATPV